MNWELATPEVRMTAAPSSAEDVAAKLIRALQNGDVAVVLTKSKLGSLIQLLDKNWTTPEEFEIFTDLKKLRDETR